MSPTLRLCLFFVRSLYLPPASCAPMRCATISQARALRLYDFVCLLCRSVSLCLNIISLAFFIMTGCLQMCATVSEKSQRYLFGVTGRNTASDSLLGVVARQEINLPLACRAQSEGRRMFFCFFFNGRMILHRDISNVSAHQHIYSKPSGFIPYGKNIHTGSKRAFKCVKSGGDWIEQLATSGA